MHWHRSLWLVLLYFPVVCSSTQRQPKCLHERHTQRTHSKTKFCDPAFSNQTAGALTQKCSFGFYREWIGSNRGQCVPCSCNGLSTECDEHTGNCVNCQYNTTGTRCERCKEGYYGNAAKRTCRACPCPFTWSNFALACLDIGSGEVECLCKRGYSGAKCERCAHGYYGNPMVQGGSCKPCNWGNSILNNCDSLNRDCATCSYSLLVDLEKMDDDLAWLKHQLQNISLDYVSHIRLNNLETNVSETKVLVVSYSAAVKHLGPKVEQLETDVNVIRDDLNQLTNMTLQTGSDLSTVLQEMNRTILKTDDLLSETESLLTAIPDLMKQLSRGSITLSENDKVRIMEEAWRIVQEMRKRACTVSAGSQQEDANKLLTLINNSMTVSMETVLAVLSQTSDSLMVSDSTLRELAELLLEAGGRVDRTQDLNLKSHATLQHLQHLQTQMEKEQHTLLPVTEMIKDLLKNISNIFLMLEEIKKELYNGTAPLDGTKWELFTKLNNTFHTRPTVDVVSKAEEHAERLYRAAAGFQQVLHTTSSTELLSMTHRGSYNRIMNVIGETEMAADQTLMGLLTAELEKEARERRCKTEVKKGLVNRAEELKDSSSHLQQEARKTQSYLKMLSRTVNSHSDCVKKQKDKRESLRTGASAVTDDLEMIRRDYTNVLIESAKTAASASNSTIRNVTDSLRSISQEVERITVTSVSVNIDDKLTDAEQTLRNLSVALPTLTNNLAQVVALSKKVAPGANMTDSIWRIKDVIEETRNLVNRLSIATTFNGKGHVELRPPRNLEDIKAFTAIDLLLNQHRKDPSKADHRRRRRQDKHRDANSFVFYLGNKDATGDYIGMALRNGVLICIYKLGGVVHEVETKSQITTTTNVNSSDLDRVVFHRVYQDAEVNITHKYTSQRPVALSPNHNFPNTIAGVLDLDADSVVVYVGGHPDDFKPPPELRYPKYRGAMKLSYINDNPVCLFNYKHAANMDTQQPHIKTPQSEVSEYYDGTGYRMAFIKAPDRKTRRLFRFHTSSRETDALLFYIGTEEDFFCVYVERGFLVLQGQQAGRELRAQTAERVSLFDKTFAITTAEKFIVQCGPHKISTDHVPTHYRSYYIGGLPAQLRQRHNITAAPLRGCVDHLTADGEIVEHNRMMGVTEGCPLPLLGIRAASLSSALSIDSLFVGGEQPVRVSLGFRTTGTHGTLLRSSSQDLQLSLADGFVVFSSNNYTLKSDKRYSDGSWHYLSAVRRLTGLELSIDNINVTEGKSHHHIITGEKFKACISNLYTRRPEQSFIPADLSSFSQMRDTVLGMCNLRSPPQEHEPVQVPAGSRCRNSVHRGEYQLYDEHSWLSYTLPQEDLNYRPHFSLDVKTTSSKGLILHVAGRGAVSLVALYIANGKIRMSLGQDRIIQHKQKSDDGNWHRVEISVEKSTFHLLVDGFRVPDGHLPNDEGSSLDLHNPVYLGGDPKSIKGHYIPINSVTGCIRDFRMNDVAVEEPEATHQILPCPDGLTEMGTYFGGGYIVKDNYFAVGSDFVLSFELRPQYLTGLLFHAESNQASLDVLLIENKVGVKVDDGSGAVNVSVTPHESLCDGEFHMVTVSKQGEVIKLEVDSMSEQKALPFMSHSTALDSLYIGGTTKFNQAPVSSPFVGCLRNVRVNERPVVFDTHSTVAGPMSISGCPKL